MTTQDGALKLCLSLGKGNEAINEQLTGTRDQKCKYSLIDLCNAETALVARHKNEAWHR